MAAGNYQRLDANTEPSPGTRNTVFFAKLCVVGRTAAYILSVIAAGILLSVVATGTIYPSILMTVLLATCILGCLFALIDLVKQAVLRTSINMLLNVGFLATFLLAGMPLFPAFIYFRLIVYALSALLLIALCMFAKMVSWVVASQQREPVAASFPLPIASLLALVVGAVVEYFVLTGLQSGSQFALVLFGLGISYLVIKLYSEGAAKMKQLNNPDTGSGFSETAQPSMNGDSGSRSQQPKIDMSQQIKPDVGDQGQSFKYQKDNSLGNFVSQSGNPEPSACGESPDLGL